MKRSIISICAVLASVLSVWATQLLFEDFEGTGTPTGWWSGSTANFHSTASPLAGSKSLRATGGQQALYQSGGAINNSEIWFSFLFRVDSLPGTTSSILRIYDTTQSFIVFEIVINSDGTLTVSPSLSDHTTVDGMSTGTIYTIWGHYQKVSSNNNVQEVSFDVSGNPRPNSGNKHAINSTGIFANDAGLFFMPSTDVSVISTFDNVTFCDDDCFAGPTPTATPTSTPTPTAASPTSTPTPIPDEISFSFPG